MNVSTTEFEILNLEKKYWNAMADNDVETAVSLTKFPAMVASPQGVMKASEEQYRQMFGTHDMSSYRNVEFENIQFQQLTYDTVVFSYQTIVNDMRMLDVSTWVKDGDKWVCGFHSETPVQ